MTTNERTVEYPEITTWAELFDAAGDWPLSMSKPFVPPAGTRYASVESATARYALWVRPTATIYGYMLRMLQIENDTKSFKVIVWADGRALVVAQYSQILGDHWLAFIDPATIPDAAGRLVVVPIHASGPRLFLCCQCGSMADQANQTVYADLNGPAFQAYYCPDCAAKKLAAQKEASR